MSAHGLYIPARTKARSGHLRIVQGVNEIRDAAALLRYSGMDVIAIHRPRMTSPDKWPKWNPSKQLWCAFT
jgi:hypothetical protein